MDCYQALCILKNGINDVVITEDHPLYGEALGGEGYSCKQILSGDEVLEGGAEALQSSLKNREVCFDPENGNRILEGQELPSDWCFPAYQCTTYECKQGSKSVPVSDQGRPGVSCFENRVLEPEEVDGYQGQKVCRAYPELLNLKNINYKNICFDAQDRYVETVPTDQYGHAAVGYNCITPVNRDATMCVTKGDGKVVFKEPGISEAFYKFCFQPLSGTTTLIDEQFQSNEGELQVKATIIAVELKALSLLLNLVGSDNMADKLDDASAFFANIGLGNIQENEIQKQAVGVLRNLESILNYYDPNNQLSYREDGSLTTIGRLRNVIELIKGSFGYKHNVAWVTLGNGFPRGFELPKGEAIYAGQTADIVDPIQQTLVLIGLMDPLSVTGQFDLVTQDAISNFQSLNGITQTGVIDTATINVLNNILSGQDSLYGGAESASINDYFDTEGEVGLNGSGGHSPIGIGTYSSQVQSLQILLYAEGYNVNNINGLYDADLLLAIQQYQTDNGLTLSDNNDGILNQETINSLNDLIRDKGYLGAGFDFEEKNIQFGSKGDYVILLQEILKEQGYYKGDLDGIFDEEVFAALQEYQMVNKLVVSNDMYTPISKETADALSKTAQQKGIGGGFPIGGLGYLKGHGSLQGKFGPGTISFAVNQADADTLKEGDIVLMYTFLDENTILIARHKSVINEVIKRRAFNDIFNK